MLEASLSTVVLLRLCCRLNQAEKVAGKFVAKRIRPALQRAREKELPELLSESRDYLKGLWSRLNGTAGRSRKVLPAELKLPPGSQKEVDKVRPRSTSCGGRCTKLGAVG